MRKYKLRRRHVQTYGHAVLGFCPKCGWLVTDGYFKKGWGSKPCKSCKGSLLILDREEDTLKISVNGKVYETSIAGWLRHVTAKGEEFFFKRVGDEGVSLSKMEAAQYGIYVPEGAQRSICLTTVRAEPSIGSKLPTFENKERAALRNVGTGNPLLKGYTRGSSFRSTASLISAEAKRLSGKSAGGSEENRDVLRKKHVSDVRRTKLRTEHVNKHKK